MSLNKKLFSFASLLFAACIFGTCAPSLRAESADDKKEEDEAKEEEKKDMERDSPQEVAVKGRVTLIPLEGDTIPVVVGTIAAKTGQEYLLKLKDPKNQRPKLAKIGAKEVQLRGYFRNKAKYLIVTDIDVDIQTPPAPVEGL